MTWIWSSKMAHVPLNINLIIPFKDNKGEALNLYRSEILRFRDWLDQRTDTIKLDLEQKIGEGCEITISARSDGNSKKYYWRFKSSFRDRKYNRLHSQPVVDYLLQLHPDIKLWLREVEEELIYINANLKLIKGILDSIEQVSQEKQELLQATFILTPIQE
jgi:hypothetical protein